MQLLSKVNWVDVLALILILRISYAGSSLGIGRQLLPLLSIVFRLVVVLFYYDTIAVYITSLFPSINYGVSAFLAFIALAAIISVLSWILNRFVPFKKPDKLIAIEKIGGAVLGCFRSVIIAGLALILILLAPIKGGENAVKNSFSGSRILKFNLDLYTRIINPILKRQAKKQNISFKRITTQSIIDELTRDRHCEIDASAAKKNVKKKARFFKEEKYE